MTWTIDESRVRPFLSAAERRDVTALLWNAPQPGRAFSEQEDPDASDAGRPPEARKRFKEFKDIKDGKDHKDGKDGKESKEVKEYKDVKDTKDGKDRKDTKDTKDSKDSKDFKDGKDSFDGAMAPPGAAAVVRHPQEPPAPGPTGIPQRIEAPADGPEQAAAALRASRINRLLRRRGVII
ncbi:hypothetical protein J2Z21_005133 [Streptomyces griseochromogenes]|uniref:Uncharacterized protein n=1 Tax=Streptomyces griseochromogenes TaxID=68214 RepID=A0A1B1AWM5_9ACTN|nr:hypothetical protein [Streptomyces griseochromogenes]ANP50932.1 hypothetical protein AVL59_16055 [Streptomyces griseochromogenes]MBP2052151.1 hypothetical protein [Streptomyces griseochromogenes]